MRIEELLQDGAYLMFGAQVIAFGAYRAIEKGYGQKPTCFVVSDLAGNPKEIEGIPVCTLDQAPRDRPVLMGVTSLLQADAAARLAEAGFRRVAPLTDAEEYRLMGDYYTSLGRFPLLERTPAAPGADLAIYEVRNHRDKPLAGHPALFPFEHPIQAGAALTETRIAPLTDDTGENISGKNRQYCELSATYWVWKNGTHGYPGIEHYRRHLLVRPEWLSQEIDAVLPLPYLSWPAMLTHLRRYVGEDVVQVMLTALETLHPAEFSRYWGILNGEYHYMYNLVCAKKPVFDAYCAWFFRITAYMESHCQGVPEILETRALSYVAEVLTSLYFLSQEDRLTLRHAAKEIYT